MNTEKQIDEIKEMARDLENHTCMSQYQAEIASKILHIKGYRKASDVAREIFEEIEKILIDNSYQIPEDFYEFYDKRGVKKALAELKKKYTEDGK